MEFDFHLNIDNYLLGRLNADKHNLFENKLESDPELAHKVEIQRKIIESLRIHEEIITLQNDLEKASGEIEGQTLPRRRIFRRKRVSKKQKLFSTLGIGTAVSIVMSLTLYYILLSKKHELKLSENHAIREANYEIEKLETKISNLEFLLKQVQPVNETFALSLYQDSLIILPNTNFEIGESITFKSPQKEFSADINTKSDLKGLSFLGVIEPRLPTTSLESQFVGSEILVEYVYNNTPTKINSLVSSEDSDHLYFNGSMYTPNGSPVFFQDTLIGVIASNFNGNIMVSKIDRILKSVKPITRKTNTYDLYKTE